MPKLYSTASAPNSLVGKGDLPVPGRIPELDALRGIGSLLVLSSHLWPSYFFICWTRADLFFVISGYLATLIALRHGEDRSFLPRYWARRALRIWPAYYTLLMIVCLTAVARQEPVRFGTLASHMTFTQNLSHYWLKPVPQFHAGAIQTWSLAIEEQFNLVWPLVVVLAGRSLIVPAAALVVVNSVAARAVGFYPSIALARWDGFALGAILAACFGGGERFRDGARGASVAFVAAAAVGVWLLSGPVRKIDDLSHSVSYLGPAAIFTCNIIYVSLLGFVVCNTGRSFLSPLRWRGLRYLGQISYGMFLYHMLIIELVEAYVGPRRAVTALAVVLLSMAVASLSRVCLEVPAMNFKIYLPYSRPAAVIAVRPGSLVRDEGCVGRAIG